VTRDLDWGIDVRLKVPKEKNYTCGLMPLLDISATKEWALREGKEGTVLERSRHEAGSFYRQRQYCFSCIIFPAMLKAEGSYILPDNVPANEFLNLEGTNCPLLKIGVWLHEYLVDFPGQQDVLRYALT
jgi:methionyl-tRNA synthetase